MPCIKEKIAVSCKTFEEKCAVLSFVDNTKNTTLYRSLDYGSPVEMITAAELDVISNLKFSKMDRDCINLTNGCQCDRNYYVDNGFKIISFAEFESQYLKKQSAEIPEYLEVLHGFFLESDNQTGIIYKTSEPFPTHLYGCGQRLWKKTWFTSSKYFKPSTKEAYDAQYNKQASPINCTSEIRSYSRVNYLHPDVIQTDDPIFVKPEYESKIILL